MAMNAKVTIYRFNPAQDKEPHYDTFSVPPEGWKDLTVLETIRYIYENLDGGLAFRQSCRSQIICGACIVRLNGKTVLACEVMSTKEMLIEPAAKYPVIKDLAVSFD